MTAIQKELLLKRLMDIDPAIDWEQSPHWESFTRAVKEGAVFIIRRGNGITSTTVLKKD